MALSNFGLNSNAKVSMGLALAKVFSSSSVLRVTCTFSACQMVALVEVRPEALVDAA